MDKRYQAVVHGRVEDDDGLVDLPLITDWPNRPRQKVDHEIGKPSQTRYWVRDRDAQAGVSRVDLEPITGRSHQLRVHMLALGHAIVGDPCMAPQPALAGAYCFMRPSFVSHPVSGQQLQFGERCSVLIDAGVPVSELDSPPVTMARTRFCLSRADMLNTPTQCTTTTPNRVLAKPSWNSSSHLAPVAIELALSNP